MIRIFFVLTLLPMLSVVAENGCSFELVPDQKLTYKTIDGTRLKLHVFEPQGLKASDKRPAIVFFFGGGWSGGTPKQFYAQSRQLADMGVVAFAAEYRVRSRNKTTPFECVKDGKSAIRWIRGHARELGVDPNRIVASGGSDGGHVAACSALIKSCEETGGENLEVSSRPNLLILFNPVLDTTARGLGIERVGEDRQTEISPCHHVRSDLPPTLLLHGTKDKTVPYENATRFSSLMKAAGNTCKLVSFKGKGHGFFNSKSFRPKLKDTVTYEKCMHECVAFLGHYGYVSSDNESEKTVSATRKFTHPGVAHSLPSLAFVKEKIAKQEQPWIDAWNKLNKSRYVALDWQPQPRAHVERGSYGDPDIGSSDFSRDSRAAYFHALCWALSGNEAHAEKAADILNAWSSTLQTVGNHDAKLLIGMSGHGYVVAAELLKHTWGGWQQKDQVQFATMLRNVWYPIIKDFFPSANGNWDASMLQVMIAMGVFLDDQEMFDRAANYYREGKGNGAIGNYFFESGQCQESGRDQAHTQMGLEFLANTCETAWIQGVDLYGALDNRLLKGFEYTAKYNLGFDVPYEPFKSFDGRYHYKKISEITRGKIRPMYERIFNHYHNRIGLDAPFTNQAAIKLRAIRPDNSDATHDRPNKRSQSYGSRASLDTLMYAEQPKNVSTEPNRK